MDLGSHVLDLLEFLCGPVISVEGTAVFDRGKSDIDSRTKIQLVFQSGATASITLGWHGNAVSYRFEAEAEKRRFVHTRKLEGEDAIIITTDSGKIVNRSDPKEEYRSLFTEFWQAVRGQPHALPHLPDGLHNLSMIASTYDAVHTERRITIGDEKWKLP